jgi:hypothetical protein
MKVLSILFAVLMVSANLFAGEVYYDSVKTQHLSVARGVAIGKDSPASGIALDVKGAIKATSISTTTTYTAATASFTTSVTSPAMSATVSGIHVSTSATSAYPCQFKGSAVSLPTTGATECDTIYQLSDHTLYVATKTVSAASDWKAVW